MVEVEEIELDLGLYIGGGTFNKPDPNPIPDSITNGFHSDSRDGQHAKRDIQALQKEEAKNKKKRESKREKKMENGLWTTVPFHVKFLPFNNNGFAAGKQMNGETENRKGKFNNGNSSCVVSDYQCSSHEDGGSTDSHSHSAHSLAEPTQLNYSKENYITSQPEQSSSSLPMRSQLGSNSEWINQSVKENQQNTTHGQSKETKVDMGKPPKPVTHTSSSLPQMPYVSTTGKGPNGKTVKGFLYKYSKSEVSIVCVCHGSTFSPAEFVQHAGGTDISHPLRHITVIPYAFG